MNNILTLFNPVNSESQPIVCDQSVEAVRLMTKENELIAREQALEAKERDLAARMQAMADIIMGSGFGDQFRPSHERQQSMTAAN